MKRIGLFLLTNILVIVTLSLVMNILGIGYYLTPYGIDYKALLAFCLLWGMGGAFISLWMSRWMAKTMMGVRTLSPSSGPYGAYVRKVHEIARRAGLREMPEVGIYESPVINAFATGRSRNSSLVAVSTGLLQKMDEDEIEGVLAHEVAHIANGDMITLALIQGVVNAFVMFLARIVAYAIESSLRGNRDGEGGAAIGGFAHMMTVFVLELVFGVLASIVVLAFSRWREYRADAGSAALVGKGKMIAALEALRRDYSLMEEGAGVGQSVQTMSISSKKGFLGLFSSHPSLEDRIRALR